MKPWIWLLVFALVLNGLVCLGLLLAGMGAFIASVVAGAALPVTISVLLLFIAEHMKFTKTHSWQTLNIIGFFGKIILIGAWVALLVSGGRMHNVIFIVTLVINFLVWHGVEAYYWSLYTAKTGSLGENMNG